MLFFCLSQKAATLTFIPYLIKDLSGDGEMAQRLRVLAACQAVVAHTFNLCEFEVSLDYKG